MTAESPVARRNPRRPQPRGDQSRAQLLAELENQLQTKSFAEVGIADLADAVGLKRSAFYFYFTSKHEAVTELLTDIFDAETSTLAAMMSAGGDPRRDIHDALAFDLRSWRQHAILFRAMCDARDGDPRARAIWETWLGRYEEFVALYIADRGVHTGSAARGLARALIAMNERLFERHVRSGGGDVAAGELLTTVVHVWCSSILGRRDHEDG